MPAEPQHTPVFTKKGQGSQKMKSQKVTGKRGQLVDSDNVSEIKSFDHNENRKRDSKAARKGESNEKSQYFQN